MFGFYPQDNGESLKGSEKGINIIRLLFWNEHSFGGMEDEWIRITEIG